MQMMTLAHKGLLSPIQTSYAKEKNLEILYYRYCLKANKVYILNCINFVKNDPPPTKKQKHIL
jgi:hypothetical protein